MKVTATVKGIPELQQRIAAMHVRIGAALARGLVRGGLLIQRASQEEAPVEYGNLRASAYTRSSGEGYATVVEVGYTSPYALFVHENVVMKLAGLPRKSGLGVYWGPLGAKSKFLEDPARENRGAVGLLIQGEIQKAMS